MPNDIDEYLIEFRRIGSYVKVSAIDPVTMQEVSIVGSASAGESELSRLAVRKLKYVLEKRAAARRGARTGRLV